MTALKPSEDRAVRGVASVRYKLNKTCAHPECSEPVESAHHCYPRSLIGNGSWFVEFTDDTTSGTRITKDAIPHVIGLCGSGTTGHHGDLEGHRAWIKLEDGEDQREFVWYTRDTINHGTDREDPEHRTWIPTGPLNPQPGNVEGKPKTKHRKKGEERKKRRTISLRVPDNEENGAELLENAVLLLEGKRGFDKPRPWYYPIVEALDYTNTHADETDF